MALFSIIVNPLLGSIGNNIVSLYTLYTSTRLKPSSTSPLYTLYTAEDSLPKQKPAAFLPRASSATTWIQAIANCSECPFATILIV